MPSTFDAGASHLMRDVGGYGSVVARCEVDQPYAQDQHETLTYRHDDGRARYLGGPLLENSAAMLERIAMRVITPTGSDLPDAMEEAAEKMAEYVLINAPKDTTQLSTSGHPQVIDQGVLVYDRPPISPRDRTKE